MTWMSKSDNPFCYFNSSPEVIRLVVMLYVRFPLSLRNVEDLLFERGIDICHETVRLWNYRDSWNNPRSVTRWLEDMQGKIGQRLIVEKPGPKTKVRGLLQLSR